MTIQRSDVSHAYQMAQESLARLKAAVHIVLTAAPDEGLRNAEIGRALGIYMGHVEYEGHISRTLLALMEAEAIVEQNKSTKRWKLRRVSPDSES